jgi:hypothetical protein
MIGSLRIITLAFSVAAAVAAQTSVSPHSNTAVDGPTLADTIKFIREMLQEQAKTTWQMNEQVGDLRTQKRFSEQLTTFSYFEASCSIFYHQLWTVNEVLYGDDFMLSLPDVKSVVVASGDEERGRGISYFKQTTYPAIFIVTLQGPVVERRGIQFTLTDEAVADRIARAFLHAVQLCGGSAQIQPVNATGVQLAGAAPERSVPSDPSLIDTLRLLQTTLLSLGKMGYVEHSQSAQGRETHHLEVEFASVVTEPNECKLMYQAKTSFDGGAAEPRSVQFSLRKVSNVSIDRQQVSENGLAEVQAAILGKDRVRSAASVVQFTRPADGFGTDEVLEVVPFATASEAGKFAGSMQHAVELCGGGKYPF